MSTTSPAEPIATIYGFPRQGANRELKKATEAYWAGRLDAEAFAAATRELRLARLAELRDAGVGEIPSNEFSLYDHVLDTSVLFGAIPSRHRDAVEDTSTLQGQYDRYFAMARGTGDVAPLEMTKWFNTNYHYLVPELGPYTLFSLNAAKPLAEFAEARRARHHDATGGPRTAQLLASVQALGGRTVGLRAARPARVARAALRRTARRAEERRRAVGPDR